MDITERYLSLRSVPGITALPRSALLALAESAEELVFRRGSLLLHQGQVPTEVYCLMQGRVELLRGDERLRVIDPPGAVGVFALFAQGEMPYTVRAVDEIVALALDADTLRETFEDDFSWMLEVARSLSPTLLSVRRQIPTPALQISPRVLRTRELGLIDRVLLIRRFEVFGPGSLGGLSEIAQQFRERRLEVGENLCTRGEHASSFCMVLEGSAVEEHGEERLQAPGAPFLNLETFARMAHAHTFVVDTPMRLLEIPWEALVDVMEDHPEMLSSVVTTLARALLELVFTLGGAQPIATPTLTGGEIPAAPLPPPSRREL